MSTSVFSTAYTLLKKHASERKALYEETLAKIVPFEKEQRRATAALKAARGNEYEYDMDSRMACILRDDLFEDEVYTVFLERARGIHAADLVRLKKEVLAAGLVFDDTFVAYEVTVNVHYSKCHYDRGDPDGDDEPTLAIMGNGDDVECDTEPITFDRGVDVPQHVEMSIDDDHWVFGTSADSFIQEATHWGDKRDLTESDDHKSSFTSGNIPMKAVIVGVKLMRDSVSIEDVLGNGGEGERRRGDDKQKRTDSAEERDDDDAPAAKRAKH